MKKNSPLYNNEIDLIILFKIIWDGKIKILLITIISLLIGFGYSYQIPSNYLNSLTIGASDKSEFIRIDNVVKLIESNKSDQIKSIKSINSQ